MPYLTGYGFVSQAQYDSIKGQASSSDTGTDAPVVTTTQSQSVSEQTEPGPLAYSPPIYSSDQVNQNLAATGYSGTGLNPNAGGTGINFAATTGLTTSSSGTFTTPTAANLPGIGSLNEDSGTSTPSSIAQQLNVSSPSVGKITPQSNVLDQYASYTYSLSLYLITVESKLRTSHWWSYPSLRFGLESIHKLVYLTRICMLATDTLGGGRRSPPPRIPARRHSSNDHN